MNYCTHLAGNAIKLTHEQATLFQAEGWAPRELPPSAQGTHGEVYGLSDANGDWIASLLDWWRHSPKAEQAYRNEYFRRATEHMRDRSDLSRCGDDQCDCRYGAACPKEDKN